MSYTRLEGGRLERDPIQPRFHIEAVPDELASAENGRPIFRTEERVQFIMPGSPNQPVFRVTDEHKQRWPAQYEAFRRGEDMSIDGTPLEQWPVLTRAMVLEMKAMGIHTVEQAATMPDTAVQLVGRGGYMLRERAKAYLDEAAGLAFSEKLNRENELLRSQAAAQQRQLDEQRELLDRMHTQLQTMQNMPHPIATYVPGEHDQVQRAQQGVQSGPAQASALDGLGQMRRRPGRPTNAEIEARRQAQGGEAA